MPDPTTIMQIQADVTEDKQAAVITMLMNGQPLGYMIVQAAELESLIHLLGRNRESLAEVVPLTLDPGARIESISDPAWRTEKVAAMSAVHLALRHPGFGWIGNLLPRHEAQGLARSLLELSELL